MDYCDEIEDNGDKKKCDETLAAMQIIIFPISVSFFVPLMIAVNNIINVVNNHNHNDNTITITLVLLLLLVS